MVQSKVGPAAAPRQEQGHQRMSSASTVGAKRQSADDPDEDLASLLGAGIKLVSRNGSDDEDTDEDEDDDDDDTEDEKDKRTGKEREGKKNVAEKEPDRIAPIPIKHRTPAPSFSVTSRPPQPRNVSGNLSVLEGNASNGGIGPGARQRSSTMVPSSTSSSFGTSSSSIPRNYAGNTASAKGKPNAGNLPPGNGNSGPDRPSAMKGGAGGGTRQRSSTMLPMMPLTASPPNVSMFPMPTKPFANRRESPASSTGDSSSGRAPLTPRDGSDLGSSVAGGRRGDERRDEWSSGVSGLGMGPGKHAKRRSVSFEDDQKDILVQQGKESSGEEESRRRERRRGEARAAIEVCFDHLFLFASD